MEDSSPYPNIISPTDIRKILNDTVAVFAFGKYKGNNSQEHVLWSPEVTSTNRLRSEDTDLIIKSYTYSSDTVVALFSTTSHVLSSNRGLTLANIDISEQGRGTKILMVNKSSNWALLSGRESCVVFASDEPLLVIKYFDRQGKRKIFVAAVNRENLFSGIFLKEQNDAVPNIIKTITGLISKRQIHFASAWIGYASSSGKHFAFPSSVSTQNKKCNDLVAKHFGEECFDGDPELGRLKMTQVIFNMLIGCEFSFKEIQIETDCNPLDDVDSCGSYPWYSRSRGDPGTNLIIVNSTTIGQ